MRILWLKTELLHPVDKGGKIRTYQMLKQLRRAHHVTYLTLEDGRSERQAFDSAEEYCHELISIPHRTHPKFSTAFYGELARNLTSPLPYSLQKYASPRMRREILRQVETGSYDVVVCDFLTPAVNIAWPLPCATVLFQHNVEATIWKRHADTQKHPLKRAYLHGQWRKTRAFEHDACRRFDRVIAVSAEDRDRMCREYGVDNVTDVPTGVDTAFFRPQGKETRQPHNLVFTGSMDWLPNDDAIRYFVAQILPRIRAVVPTVSLTVVGRNPYPGLVELSKRDPAITVTGRVRDVRPYMERAAAYIVPIRIGGGTRLKIYEAMAMEKPVISTTVGAEGLPLRPGTDLLLADTPEAFANEVIRVLTQEAQAIQIGQQGAATVRQRFSWEKVAAEFADQCQSALRPQTLADHAVVSMIRA